MGQHLQQIHSHLTDQQRPDRPLLPHWQVCSRGGGGGREGSQRTSGAHQLERLEGLSASGQGWQRRGRAATSRGGPQSAAHSRQAPQATAQVTPPPSSPGHPGRPLSLKFPTLHQTSPRLVGATPPLVSVLLSSAVGTAADGRQALQATERCTPPLWGVGASRPALPLWSQIQPFL